MFASCALSRLRFAGGTPPDERRMSRELFLPLSGETERQEGGGGGFLLDRQSWHLRGIPRHRFVVEHLPITDGLFSERYVNLM